MLVKTIALASNCLENGCMQEKIEIHEVLEREIAIVLS